MAKYVLVDGEKYEYEVGDDAYSGTSVWAVSTDLVVTVDVGGTPVPVGAAKLHDTALPPPKKGIKGNVLAGGVTVVFRTGEHTAEAQTLKVFADEFLEPHKLEGVSGVAHSEFQFFLGMTEIAAHALTGDTPVLGVIFEAHQTNTPCAGCQKQIAGLMANLERRTGKPTIFRGTATRLYESAPGKLGTALHKVGLKALALDEDGVPRMEDIHGLHRVLGT